MGQISMKIICLPGSLLSANQQNKAYSSKALSYPGSQFLIARCQQKLIKGGKNDQITRAMKRLNPAEKWDAVAIVNRQEWLAELSLEIWQVGQQ